MNFWGGQDACGKEPNAALNQMFRGKENMKKRILLPFVAFVLCLFMITPALAAEGKMNVAVICGTDAA